VKPVRSLFVGRIRVGVAAIVMATGLFFAAPVAAQGEPDDPAVTVLEDEESLPETQIILDEDTSAIVQRIRRELIVVAVAMAAGLVVFIWHTSPSRRLRVATRRADAAIELAEDD
jgi:hypothetical protein